MIVKGVEINLALVKIALEAMQNEPRAKDYPSSASLIGTEEFLLISQVLFLTNDGRQEQCHS